MFEAIDGVLMQFKRNFSCQSGTVGGDRGTTKGKVHLPSGPSVFSQESLPLADRYIGK